MVQDQKNHVKVKIFFQKGHFRASTGHTLVTISCKAAAPPKFSRGATIFFLKHIAIHQRKMILNGVGGAFTNYAIKF